MGKIDVDAIRPLLRALDDAPVHVRQLADMFRKHGNAHKRNKGDITDLDDRDLVPDSLQNGWKSDSDWTPDSVVSWKGDAPDPSDYLDDDYITQHLDQFKDGASRIYFSDSLHQYGPGQADNSTFVFPTSELQRVLDETGGDAHALADALGMKPEWFHVDNDLNKPLKDVEIRNFAPEELTNLRVPSGNEAGANENWIPGGYLPTGVPEAVIDVPESATGTKVDYNPGLWPGTGQGLTLGLNS
ncbi:hypothetical protein WDU99_12195 [Microbacterium sp. Mu-80]|uniref:Uncharacterized protein n=1 Tax=Microbacterium bandirmense TaxID=3122050 RepID=A0ABU8LE51_9MICO